MTGTTAVVQPLLPATKEVGPATTIPRNFSTDSEEEPWDQKKKTKKQPAGNESDSSNNGNSTSKKVAEKLARMRNEQAGSYVGGDELEDGDLPALTRGRGGDATSKTVGGRFVNGQRTTTRPLSPPSRAGMPLSAAESKRRQEFWDQFDEEDDDEEREVIQRKYSEEDGPHDEKEMRMESRMLAHRRAEQARRRQDNEDADSSVDPASLSMAESGDHGEVNFCSQTLEAIGDMCGAGLGMTGSPSKKPIQDSPDRMVERPTGGSGGKATAAQTSGRGLGATDEDQEHTAIEVEFVEPASGLSPQKKNAYLTAMARKAKEDFEKNKGKADMEDSASTKPDQPVPSDVYNSFSASEKRKFLKLISSGKSPAEASDVVFSERSEKERAKGEKGTPQKKSILAFWKRGQAKPGSPSNEEEAVSHEANSAAPEKSVVGNVSTPKRKVEPIVDDTTPETDSSDGENPQFAKSGINYYDAVRRDQSSDEDSEKDVTDALSDPGSKSSATAGRLKAKGFAVLEEKRSRSVPRIRIADDEIENAALPPRAPSRPRNVDIEAAVARTLAAADTDTKAPERDNGPSSSRTVSSLAKDVGKDDKKEKADTLDDIEKNLLRPIPKDGNSGRPPKVQARTPEKSSVAQVQLNAMELDMQSYISSTQMYSPSVGQSPGDNASIYSVGTGVTGASTYTQSSRVRRPGVAKERLAKAKQAELDASKKGWLESIKAAAETTNRVWDAKHGWVDFKQQDNRPLESQTSGNKIHLDLERAVKRSSRSQDGALEMGDAGGDAVPVPFPPGWHEERNQMLAASSPPSVPSRSPKEGELRVGGGASESTSDKKLTQWIAKTEQGPTAERSAESSDRAVASNGVESEKNYMQLAENGAVQAFTKEGNTSPSQVEVMNAAQAADTYVSDDSKDHTPLLTDSGSFSAGNNVTSTNVVKEKVEEEDMNLFQHEESKGVRLRGRRSPAQPQAFVARQGSYDSASRRSGPVDVDEVDENWDSDDEERLSQAASGFTQSSSQSSSKKVPKLKRSKRDTSPISVRRTAPQPSTAHSVASRPAPVTPDATDRNKFAPAAPEPTGVLGASRMTERAVSPEETQDVRQQGHLSPKMMARLRQFERPGGPDEGDFEVSSQASAEWKSFLGKKVRAESLAAAKREERKAKEPTESKQEHGRRSSKGSQARPGAYSQDADTLFEFQDKNSHRASHTGDGASSTLDLSELSPIETKGEGSDYEVATSDAYGPDPEERRSFFKRLTECAAPVMSKAGESMPNAHLAFLRTNGTTSGNGSSRYVPTSLCGRTDSAMQEDGDGEESVISQDVDETAKKTVDRSHRSEEKTASTRRSRSRTRAGSEVGSTTSASDFGAKTAYLEAIARKTAVSKPRSVSRRRSRSIGGSSVASTSSNQSERWKAYLEKKRASQSSPAPGKQAASTSDVSKAAEKYAAEKVEEMMSMMASRSKSAPRSVRDDKRLDRMIDGDSPNTSADAKSGKKTESIAAAEDLAAARVEAMMAALSNSQHDEGEI